MTQLTMLLLRSVLTLALLWNQVAGNSDSEDDWYSFLVPRTKNDICQPSRTGMKEYYGFRIQHQIVGRFPNIRHTRISECDHSEVQGWDAYYPSSQGQDIQWGKKLCQQGLDGEALCVILARTKKMARRHTSLFIHGTYIGGLFQCPGRLEDDEFECTNANVLPLYPLYADDPIFAFGEVPDLRHLVFRIPMVATADESNPLAPDIMQYVRDPKWHQEIDIYENYDYTVDERSRFYRAYDDMYTRLAAHAHVPLRLNFPTIASHSVDNGDGIARRLVYKKPIRRLFEPHLWLTNDIHPAPLRAFDVEPLTDSELAALSTQTTSDFRLPSFQFDQLATIMGKTSPQEWLKLKQDVDTIFKNVVDTIPFIPHRDPPNNVTAYLKARRFKKW